MMYPCPKCNGLASYNSHFGRHICLRCGWVSDSSRQNVPRKKLKFKETQDHKKVIFA